MNNMKKYLITLICSLLALSCAKEGTKLYTGSYSFKTSGSITLSGAGDGNMTLNLPTESGIMDIVETDREAGEMIVTMNVLGGDILIFDATAREDGIVLKPMKRYIGITLPGTDSGSTILGSGIGTYKGEISISGRGKRYDDLIIFNLVYDGKLSFDDGEDLSISGSDVRCRAKKNEE